MKPTKHTLTKEEGKIAALETRGAKQHGWCWTLGRSDVVFTQEFPGNRIRVESAMAGSVKCGCLENLQAHYVEPVPKRGFDDALVHRIENLQTLCQKRHAQAPKIRQ